MEEDFNQNIEPHQIDSGWEQQRLIQEMEQFRINQEMMRDTKPSRYGWVVVLVFLIVMVCLFFVFKANARNVAYAAPEVSAQSDNVGKVDDLKTEKSMLDEYAAAYDSSGEYQALKEQVDKINANIEETKHQERQKRTWAFLVALIVGLVPVVFIGLRVIKERTWRNNMADTMQSLAIAFAGGVLLFAFNYFILMMKIKYGDGFNRFFVTVFVLLGLAVALFFVIKGKRKE